METYINSFEFASYADEVDFIANQRRTCYNGIYPFKIFPEKGFERIDFSPITIFSAVIFVPATVTSLNSNGIFTVLFLPKSTFPPEIVTAFSDAA